MAEWRYDLTEVEPAPVVEGTVFARWGLGVTVPQVFHVDTGASTTVIPRTVLVSLGVPVIGATAVRYADDRVDLVPVYEVDVEIIGIEIRGIEVVAGRMDQALLGRDVLNYFVLTLDGPNGLTRLEYRG